MDRLSYLPTVLALYLATASPAFSQGDLTPPGAPAPTMKTLDQVEPRTPLVDSSAGVSVATSGAITISASGSYYLTGNHSSSAAGISITASNVSVDLNGFTLEGTTTFSSSHGISAQGTATDVITGIHVSNGLIEGFSNSIRLRFINHSSVCHLRCSNSNAASIIVGHSAFECQGIIVEDCTVSDAGPSAYAGIQVSNGSHGAILRNRISGVTGSTTTVGIRVDGDSNRVEGNQVGRLVTGTTGSNVIGLWLVGADNLASKNIVSGAADNFSFGFNNIYGPEVNTTGELSDTNPWANFSLNENP